MSEKKYIKGILKKKAYDRSFWGRTNKGMGKGEFLEKTARRKAAERKQAQTKGEKLSLSELKAVTRKTRVQGVRRGYRQAGMSRRSPASTRYGREHAKGTGYTVKELAKKDYQTAMRNSGKTGREAFRFAGGKSGPILKRHGGKKTKSPNYKERETKMVRKIIKGDPLSQFPNIEPKKLQQPDIRNIVKKGYVSKILSEKSGPKTIINKKVKGGEYEGFGTKYWTNKTTGKVEPLTRMTKIDGEIDADKNRVQKKTGPNRKDTFRALRETDASATIAKRKKVRANEARRTRIKKEGVGKDSLKEREERRKLQSDAYRENNPESVKESSKKAEEKRRGKREKKNIQKREKDKIIRRNKQASAPHSAVKKGPNKGEPYGGISMLRKFKHMMAPKGRYGTNPMGGKRPPMFTPHYAAKPSPKPKLRSFGGTLRVKSPGIVRFGKGF